jgi:uncharacterized protein (TIGR02996 family)
MTHADAFLAAILAEPDADVHRLVYADWLDEHGDPDRAEFIRVQCAVAIDPLAHNPPPSNPRCACSLCTLRRRERALLASHQVDWRMRDLPGMPFGNWVTDFRRGFVAEVTLACDQWMRHGPALVRAAPLEGVGLADRKPLRHDGWFFWLRHPGVTFADDLPYLLPDDLAYVMSAAERREGWESEAAAREALSVACLTWARKPVAATH